MDTGAIVAVSYDASGRRLATIHAGESGVIKVWQRRDTSTWAVISAWQVDGSLTSVDWAGEDVSSGLLATVGERGGMLWEERRKDSEDGDEEGEVVFEIVGRLGEDAASEVKFGRGGVVGVGGCDGVLRIWKRGLREVWRLAGVVGEGDKRGGGLCWGKGVGAKGLLLLWGGEVWMGTIGGVEWESVVKLEMEDSMGDGEGEKIVSADWTALSVPLTWVIAVARENGIVEIYCVDPLIELGLADKKAAVIKMATLEDAKSRVVTKLEWNRTVGFLLAGACDDGRCLVWQPREDSLEEWSLVKTIGAEE